MNLKDIGEFGFINKISQGCLVRPESVVQAIGDDAAAFYTSAGELTLVTTDLLVERVHFRRPPPSGFADLGHKALAVNLSDIAAMGGIAREAFVSIAIPENCPLDCLQEFYNGMLSLAREFEVNVLGGDTTASKQDLIINISVVGSVPESELMTRDAAQPGDVIFCNGFLGDSRAGLYLIENQVPADDPSLAELIKAHCLPWPHLTAGRFLAQQAGVHAAIDVSDGLSSDLGHIASAGRVGARLDAEKIPISPHLEQFCTRFDFDPIEYALAGGEDYTLIVTIAPENAAQVQKAYGQKFDTTLFALGEIVNTDKIELVYPDGRTEPMAGAGWDHFKRVE